MACKSCGSSSPVRIVRSVNATKLSTKQIQPLRPKRKQVMNIPKPANPDRYRI